MVANAIACSVAWSFRVFLPLLGSLIFSRVRMAIANRRLVPTNRHLVEKPPFGIALVSRALVKTVIDI